MAMPQIIKDGKVLAANRERLIKAHLAKQGKGISSRIPTQEWYDNYDRTFKKKVK